MWQPYCDFFVNIGAFKISIAQMMFLSEQLCTLHFQIDQNPTKVSSAMVCARVDNVDMYTRAAKASFWQARSPQ